MRKEVVLALGHAAMFDAPLARPLERAGPQADTVLARRLLGVRVVAIGDSPAVLDQPAVEVDATGRADREQPAVAVALPAGAVDRVAASQLDERLARGATARVGRAVFLAALIVFRSVDASEANTLALERDRVAVIDHSIAGNVPG